MPDGSQTYSYTNSNIHGHADISKKHKKHINYMTQITSPTDVANKFQISSLTEMFDRYTSYPQRQKPDACVCICICTKWIIIPSLSEEILHHVI